MRRHQYYYHCKPLPENGMKLAVMIEIPDWLAAHNAVEEGRPTPLDVFIDNHEPAGRDDEAAFRSDLQNLLDYIFYLGGAPTLRGSLSFGDKPDGA